MKERFDLTKPSVKIEGIFMNNEKLNARLSTLPVRIKTLGGFMGQSIQTSVGDVQQWYGTWFHQVNLNGPILGDPCIEFIQVKEVEKIESENKELRKSLCWAFKKLDYTAKDCWPFGAEEYQELERIKKVFSIEGDNG